MVLKVDFDPYQSPFNDSTSLYKHYDMYSTPRTNILSVYWAPYMGASTHILSYAKSLELLKASLLDIQHHDNHKSIFIDQLNFFDNSLGYENNPVINTSQLHNFLANLSPVLKKYTVGYALWTYRNTTDNYIYNASFSNTLKGWDLSGKVKFISTRSLTYAQLTNASSVSQLIGADNYAPPTNTPIKVSFLFKSLRGDSRIRLIIGNYSSVISLQKKSVFSKEVLSLPKSTLSKFNFTIEDVGGNLDITQVNLYTHEAIGKVLRQNGSPDALLGSIVSLNKKL